MAEHWCKEHQTVWFKKGKMKNYAHPILDEDGEPTGKWCNEPEPKTGVVAKTSEPSRGGSTNDSIESQVAIKEIGLDWREGKLPDDSIEVKVYRRWITEKTEAGLVPSNPSPPEGEAQPSQIPVVATITQEQLTTLKVLKEQYKLNLGMMIKACGWNEIKAIAQLTQEQAEHLIAKIKRVVDEREDNEPEV